MVSDRQCQGLNREGKPCTAFVQPGKTFCVWHDPARQAEAQELRRRGGRNKSRAERAQKLVDAGLRTLGDLQDVLLEAIVDAKAGTLDPKIANAVANLAGRVKDLVVGVELEEQLAKQQRRLVELSDRVG